MRRKCERIVKKFRQCPGAPRECLEETREETDETNATSGGMMPGGSSNGGGFESHQEFFKTWEGTLGGGGSMFPFGGMLGALFGDEPPGGPLNKDGREDAGRMNDRRPAGDGGRGGRHVPWFVSRVDPRDGARDGAAAG